MNTQENATSKKKLVAFVGLVVVACAAIVYLNRHVATRESVDDPEERTKLAAALGRLVSEPKLHAIKLTPGAAAERVLRHLHVPLLSAVDVLVLGQSDADHLSSELFRDDVHFYNGFISNSFFAYQYEVYESLSSRGVTPQVVLWDVRSGYVLQQGEGPAEPPFEAPSSDARWFAGPPFRGGVTQVSLPIWSQMDSLLSLRQTQHSLVVLSTPRSAETAGKTAPALSGFELVPRWPVATVHRWLADGTRVYPGELDGRLAPRAQPAPNVTEAVGRRIVRTAEAEAFGAYVARVVAAGSRVIAYAPPIHPLSYADPAQRLPLAAFDEKMKAVLGAQHVDFCNLTTEATRIGCQDADFYDELHISRACNEKVLRSLVSGCAPLAEGVLRPLVKRALLVP